MKITVPMKRKECQVLLGRNLDSRLDFGMERHVGWVFSYFFSMAYHSNNEVGRLFYPIFHKAMGILVSHKESTRVYYVVFRGLTDPVSLLLVFGGSLLIVSVALEGIELSFPLLFWMALFCAVLAAGITFLFSILTPSGRQAYKQLKKTLQVILTNAPGV